MSVTRLSGSRQLLLGLVFILPFIVYSITLTGDFVYDDNGQVLENPWITDVGRIPEIFTSSSRAYMGDRPANTYRPLVYLVFMAEYYLFGLTPWGFHLVNLLLHSINSVLIFMTVEFITGEKNRVGFPSAQGAGRLHYVTPFFASLVFALHPINSEVVSWVSGIPELTYS